MPSHPFCRLCIPLIGPSYEELDSQLAQAVKRADCIELRLDRMSYIDIEKIEALREKYPIPMIFTLRKESQGGQFTGSEEKRYALFSALLALTPEYVDIEADTPPNQFHYLKTLSSETKWILSWHEFEVTPARIDEIFKYMRLQTAHYYKLATRANSIGDAFRMLRLAKEVNAEHSILTALSMGELGHCSRILAPVVGCPFAYASLDEGLETAPGQLTADTLLDAYHFRHLNRETLILGLIGDPIDKSQSHITHNAVFRRMGLNAVYIKFKVNRDEVVQFFIMSSGLNIKGLSVTMPLKEAMSPFIEYAEPSLKAIKAVNTLSFQGNEIIGYNTDGVAALKALDIEELKGKKIIIIGAGGTAKAIAYAAHQQGADLTILNRTPLRAQELARRLNCEWGSLEEFSSFAKQGVDVLIQATSIGMAPHANEMPISLEDLPTNCIVLDIISHPKDTKFLQQARLKGCKTINGIELFIYQAVEQFVFWFGNDRMDPYYVEQIIREQLLPSPIRNTLVVQKSQLKGSIRIPSSKSHTIRAVLLGAMADGLSTIHYPLPSPDTKQAIQAARFFGASIEEQDDYLEIEGVKGVPQIAENIVDAGNSGQVLRFAAALAALNSSYTVFTGDASIRTNRPVQTLLEGLRPLGVFAESTRGNGYAPFIVRGPLQAGITSLAGEDSQPVSALLMAAAFVEGTTEIHVKNPGETPWLALTLSWLDRLGVSYENKEFKHFIVKGARQRPAFTLTIPGDFSSAAFPLVAAILTNSELTIQNVDMNDIQGDKLLIPLLQEMGASIAIDQTSHTISVGQGAVLKGRTIDVNPFIDAITILAVVGCFAEGETRLINGAIAHQKESDRIACIARELKKMGADIFETEDGLIIRPSALQGAHVASYGDHRIALSLAVAGLASEGETIIDEIDCIKKSYPTFIADMVHLNARFFIG